MTIEERRKKIEELDMGYKKLMERRAADPTRKQTVVKIGEDEVEVDNLISDCIQSLNDAGFNTLYSCSGHEQDFFTKGYIMFGGFDYDKLLTILNDIPEFIVEHDFRIQDKYYHFGSMHLVNPSKDQTDMAQLIMSQYGPYEICQRLVIRLSFWADSERWVPEYRDQNFEDTVAAFNKLKEAVSNGKNSG